MRGISPGEVTLGERMGGRRLTSEAELRRELASIDRALDGLDDGGDYREYRQRLLMRRYLLLRQAERDLL